MADTCPQPNSCGTRYPIWSDEEPPEEILTISTINAYTVSSGDCKSSTLAVEVMRCSLDTDDDIIYRFTGSYLHSSCEYAFCGVE